MIATAMAEEGLEYMSVCFVSRHKSWLKDGHTWSMHQGGWGVLSRNNYIMGIYSRLFQNKAVQDARHNTDHYLVLVGLCGAAPAAH